MPLPRPQGAVVVAEVGAEVTVQQQLCSVLLVACPRLGASQGDIMALGRKRGLRLGPGVSKPTANCSIEPVVHTISKQFIPTP